MSNGETRKQCPWELWVLFFFGTIVIAVTAGIGLIRIVGWPRCLWELLFGGYIDPQQSNYLLSATAQVLGALFALVFTITLIAVQFVTKYTHRTMKIIFNWRLIFYMAGFACSVILPLWWLLNPTELGTYISIVTGSLVVLSLILLFLDLRKRMNIGWIITYLKEEGLRALGNTKLTEEKREGKAKENINALDSIAMGAYTDLNFEVFELAEEALADLLIKVGEILNQLKEDSEEKKRFSKIHKSINSKLRDICWDTIDNSRAPIITVLQVERIGINAVETKDWHTETTARNIIVAVAQRCIRDTRIRLSIQCFLALFRVMGKHPPKAPLADTVRGETTMQDAYIDDMLQIYDIHLEKGWQGWLEWLLGTIVQFIPRYEPSEKVSKEILINIWLTDARFDKPNTMWLHNLLAKNGILEAFLKVELYNSAVEKGKKLGITEERLKARWVAFQNLQKWLHDPTGNLPPPE